jgi:hypothetical protein
VSPYDSARDSYDEEADDEPLYGYDEDGDDDTRTDEERDEDRAAIERDDDDARAMRADRARGERTPWAPWTW